MADPLPPLIAKNAQAATPKTSVQASSMRPGADGRSAAASSTRRVTLGGIFKRKQTGNATWEEAKAVAALWEKARSWEADRPEPDGAIASVGSSLTLRDAGPAGTNRCARIPLILVGRPANRR